MPELRCRYYGDLTITLNPEQEEVVNDVIRSGKFRSVDEVISAALATLTAGREPAHPAGERSRIWELREGLSLGDISIKDLIEEGRL